MTIKLTRMPDLSTEKFSSLNVMGKGEEREEEGGV